MWQPGKVMTNKINTNHTYLDATNYWAPLEDNNNKKQGKEINIIKQVDTEQNQKNEQMETKNGKKTRETKSEEPT